MWNEPSKARLDRIPRIYESGIIPTATPLEERLVHLHFFIGGFDWYAIEFDGEDLFFGFANLGDDLNAEWGYFSFSELKSIAVSGIQVDCELLKYFRPRPAREIENIRRPMGWEREPVKLIRESV